MIFLRSRACRAVLCLCGLGVPAGQLPAQEAIFTQGHNDLGVNYVPGTGWEAYIHDYGDGSKRSALNVVYSIGEAAETEVPDDPDFSLLGPPGDRIWVVPEIYNPEIIYLGIGAPLLGRNIFAGGLSNRGQLSMRLISVTGTGPEAGGTLTMWQSGFPPRVHFSSADGIGPDDRLEGITANFHAHYNWAFTEPGLYRVTFEFSGTLVPELGGEDTATEVTYTFEVLHAGRDSVLRYAWPLGDGWEWSSWMGTVYESPSGWILTRDHGWIYPLNTDPGNLWIWLQAEGWVWTNDVFYPWLLRPGDGGWLAP